MADPILIVAALNGTRDRKVAKKLPYTPAEIAKEAKRAVDAGAGVVHVHARRDDGGIAFDLTFDEIVRRHPRARRRADLDHDAAHAADLARHRHRALRRAARAARARDGQRRSRPRPTCPRTARRRARSSRRCERAGVAPEPGINSLEAIADVEALYEDGLLAQAPWLHLELGGAGRHVRAGPRRHARATCCASSTRSTARSASCAGSRTARAPRRAAVCATAAALGGHVRVGLEDSALLPDGTPATLQRRARRAGRRARRRPGPRAHGARRGARACCGS